MASYSGGQLLSKAHNFTRNPPSEFLNDFRQSPASLNLSSAKTGGRLADIFGFIR